MDTAELIDPVGVVEPGGHALDELRELAETCDPRVLDQLLREAELEARALEARRAVLLAAAERRKVYRADAHASIWGMLRANLSWSDAECRNRMRIARLCDRFPEALHALASGDAPIANLGEIARGYANPRVGEQIEDVLGQLLNDAARLEHDEIRRQVSRWEMLTDSDGAHRQAGVDHESRNAHVTEFAGIVTVVGTATGIEGAEMLEIFERFADAEFQTDWDAAKAQYGDQVNKALLTRTDAQRRADALLAIFRTAAAAAPGTQWRRPVVNILVDQHTFEDHLTMQGLFPERYENPFETNQAALRERRCETSSGVLVTPAEALQAAIAGWMRFQIVNTAGKVIRQGRRQRTFTGPTRDAVTQQSVRCPQPGCRVRRNLQADHAIPYSAGGETTLENGQPACPRHNRDRYTRGYTVTRTVTGWHTFRPDGTEI